jgi:predicted acylesterase/phospholipase RssA
MPVGFALVIILLPIASDQISAVLSDLLIQPPYDSAVQPVRTLSLTDDWLSIRWARLVFLVATFYVYCHVSARLAWLLLSDRTSDASLGRGARVVVWLMCTFAPTVSLCVLSISTLWKLAVGSKIAACVLPLTLMLLLPMQYIHLAYARPSSKRAAGIFAVFLLPLVFFFGTSNGDLLFFAGGSEVRLADHLGPISALLLALSVLTLALTLIIVAARRLKTRWIMMAMAWPLFLSLYDVNDNHPVRFQRNLSTSVGSEHSRARIDRQGGSPAIGQGDLLWAISKWQNDRVGKFRRPIVLVSAAGGGIRAAYFSAAVLGRIADKCPAIAQNILVVSGVSGGALGAAAYAYAVRDHGLSGTGDLCDFSIPGRGYYESRLDSMFRRDFLTPVMLRAAFPESAQSILPFPINSFDRQLGLELALRTAFADEFHSGRFDQAFGQPEGQLALPIVMVGATEVVTGDQTIFTDLDQELGTLDRTRELNSAAVVANSARFPLISPPGYLNAELRRDEKGHALSTKLEFVDGGYFDNSGAYGLLSVVSQINYWRVHTRYEEKPIDPETPILWIQISNSPSCVEEMEDNLYLSAMCDKRAYDYANPSYRLRELAAPLRAVIEARDAREEMTFDALSNLMNVKGDADRNRDAFIYVLQAPTEDIPLGWYLSEASANSLSWQISPKATRKCELNSSRAALADCALRRIQYLVHPDAADPRDVDTRAADWIGGYDGVFEASCLAYSRRQANPKKSFDECINDEEAHLPTSECLMTQLHESSCELKPSEWSKWQRGQFGAEQ